MEEVKNLVASVEQLVEKELTKFDPLQVIQQKVAELKQLVADFEAGTPSEPAQPADPNQPENSGQDQPQG